MPRSISGARAVLKIDEHIVGWATGIQGQETIEMVPIAILGELDIQDHEIVGRACSVTASTVRLLEEPMSLAGGGPGTGIAVGSTDDILSNAANFRFTIIVFDEVGEVPLYTFSNCKMTSRSFTVDRGGVMAVNVTFVATRMYDNKTAVV